MGEKMNQKVRWSTYFPAAVSEQLETLAAEFGVTRGQFLLILVKLGLQAFLRSYQPERLFTAEQWKTLMEAGKDAEIAASRK